jgi:hypothetical protein
MVGIDPLGQTLKYISGNVFRGRILVLKERKVIQVMMIQFGENIPGELLEFTEVQQDPARIQTIPAHHHFHLPVMPMEILTLSPKIAQIVCGGEFAYDFDLVDRLIQRQVLHLVFNGRLCFLVDLSAFLAAAIGTNHANAVAVAAKDSILPVTVPDFFIFSRFGMVRRCVQPLPAMTAVWT